MLAKKKSWRREKLQKELMKQVEEQIRLDRIDKEHERAMKPVDIQSFKEIYEGRSIEPSIN